MPELAHRVESFIDKLNHAANLDDIYLALRQQLEFIGFDYFAYLIIRSPDGPHESHYLGTYPHEWSVHYVAQDYVHIDPVIAKASNRITPFRWKGVRQELVSGSRTRIFFDEAGDFGLQQGFTIPIHGPGQALATLNAAAKVNDDQMHDLWCEYRHALHLIALHCHEAILRQGLIQEKETNPQLTPRERECLAWTARGKSAWETSMILGISESTVTWHLKSACGKLNVHSRTHAVVKAVLLGLIVPEKMDLSEQYQFP